MRQPPHQRQLAIEQRERGSDVLVSNPTPGQRHAQMRTSLIRAAGSDQKERTRSLPRRRLPSARFAATDEAASSICSASLQLLLRTSTTTRRKLRIISSATSSAMNVGAPGRFVSVFMPQPAQEP